MTTAAKARRSIERPTTFEERLARAEGLHSPKAGAAQEKRRALAAKWLAGDLAALVELADGLMVDPRWLATGRRSQASYTATRALYFYGGSHAVVKDATKAELARLDALAAFFELLPEIEGYPGECRYCGCTDAHGCGDCTWVNQASSARTSMNQLCIDRLLGIEAVVSGQ